jgi:UDP-glucose-4-epimerase GalE
MTTYKTTILVTGGAGYVGSHICKALARAGYGVVVYDNLSTGHRDLARWGLFVHGDILDYTSLTACMRAHHPVGIIHCAAYAYVGESVIDPGKYFRNNVDGTLTLLSAAQDTGIGAVVVSGTCAVYGMPQEIPVTEACPTGPINPYGASKLFMERMLADFEKAHGLHWISLRYFNAAGADPDAETGERHFPETHLIPRLFMAACGEAPPLQIFGRDYPTPDGTCIRDYVHVTDLAEAHLAGLDYCLSGKAGVAVNLGTGKGLSVLEIIQAAGKLLGRDIPYSFVERRSGDPPSLVAAPSLAQELLGWIPQFSEVETILVHAHRYYDVDRQQRMRLLYR